VRPAAAAKGVTLHCRVDKRCVGDVVSGDPARLQQAVWNLLTNAVKFTPKGGEVTVDLSREGDELTVCVRDTGIGIAPAFLPYVFDRFRQADSSSRRSHGGLGLGLSIVKQLVEMHGGRVGVRSQGEGCGSEFFFALPLKASGRGPAVQPCEPEGATVRPSVPASGTVSLPRVEVLLVDDDVDGRDVVARFLTDAEATVRTAGTVEEARHVLASSSIDVLLSDIGMPGEDGYDLIRWVRASDSPRIKTLPAVALTAFARADDRVRVVASGYNDHVSKPVDPDALIAVVHRLHSGAAAV
jgi:CheY-like chemotaxis protein/anti-sigma regulatory factor (Ser/Thr protein kinase)